MGDWGIRIRRILSFDFLFKKNTPNNEKDRISMSFILLVILFSIIFLIYHSFNLELQWSNTEKNISTLQLKISKLESYLDTMYNIAIKRDSINLVQDSIAAVKNKLWFESLSIDLELKRQWQSDRKKRLLKDSNNTKEKKL